MRPRPRELAVGDVLDGKYRIVGNLGSGGMGTVYAARRLALGDVVALKTLLPGIDGVEARRRFLREAQAAASIRHPNVVQVFDFGNAAVGGGVSAPYLVMELVEGPTLAEELRTQGPFDIDRALRLFGELCAAVEAGHRRGIVHRDLKPGNVMIAQPGDVRETVKVIDFGIARVETEPITQDGVVLGTFQYLAPEQLRGEAADATSDVWALAVILYEVLTGKLPFFGSNPAATLFAIARAEHVPPRKLRPELPAEVDEAIARALAPDPAARPSARDLAAALGTPLPSIDTVSRHSSARWSDADDSGAMPAVVSLPPGLEATLGRDGEGTALGAQAPHPFVGREAELHALRSAWEGALRGEGKIALVTGEAGIGKTRLVGELLAYASAQGATVQRGVFFDYEGSQPRPFATFLDMLGADDVALADDMPAADKWRTFSRIADLYARGRSSGPLVLLFEDLHWARAQDLELILHLHRALAREAALIVATARTDAGAELSRFVAQLGDGRALAHVALAPLAADDIRAWLSAALGDVRIRPTDLRRLERATGGNPYFLDELIRHLVSVGRMRRDGGGWTCDPLDDVTLPPTLGSVVRAQIDALGPHSRDALETAAVIGDEMRFETLRTATELDEDALDEILDRAVRRRLLTEQGCTGGNDYRFVSDTTRRVLYEAMSPRRRRRLHRKVVDALHVRYAATLRQLARVLCYHHHAVGDYAEALSFGVQAAEDDLHAHDIDRAEASIRRAREAEVALRADGATVDPGLLPRLDLVDGTVACRLGLHERARAALRHVLEATPPAPAGVRLQARLELAQVLLGGGDADAAMEQLSAAIGLARTGGDLARMQLARILYAVLESRVGHADAALASLRAVVEELDESASPALRSLARRALAWESIKSGAFRDGEEQAREALELARRARDPVAEREALSALAAAFIECGDAAAGIPFQRDALAIARALSSRRDEALGLARLGQAHLDLDRLDEALGFLAEARAIFVEIGDSSCEGDCTVMVGRTLLAMGRVDEAIERLEYGQSLCDSAGRGEFGALARLFLGESRLARGDVASAIASLEQARELFVTQRLHHLWRADWALARAKSGAPEGVDSESGAHSDAEARMHAERAAEDLREQLAQLPKGASDARLRAALDAIERHLSGGPAGDDDDDLRPTSPRNA
ncbi:MAG: protein kinase [Deltaproteobacteria bacterium]|nr:protein kinase [Deltaproteobacteria bacterium]